MSISPDPQQIPSQRAALLHELEIERRRIASCVLIERVSLLLDVDLTIQQLRVLLILASGTASTAREIAAMLEVSAPTVSALVDRLVEHEYVTRQADAHDRRVTTLVPTARALELREDLMGVRELADDVLNQLTESELAALLVGTRALAGALDTASQSSPG